MALGVVVEERGQGGAVVGRVQHQDQGAQIT